MQTPNPETCGAKNRDGTPCARTPGWGTSHPGVGRCRAHGGASPRAEMGGAMQLARQEMQVMGIPLAIAPHEALLQCIAIAAGEVAYATEQISKLELHDAIEDTMFGKQVNVWIKVRHQSMDRLAHYSKLAVQANVADRQVRIAEQQGQLIASAIRGVLQDLGVGDREGVPRLVRKHLALAA